MYKNLESETKLFSVIPIYSRSIDEWHNNYDKKFQKYITEKKESFESEGMLFDKNLQLTFEIRFNERSVPWRYNDIVGFIELRLFQHDLLLYFYKREKRKFMLDDHFNYVIDTYFRNDYEKQFSSVLDGIKEIKKQYPKFKKKYFDTEMFSTTLELLQN